MSSSISSLLRMLTCDCLGTSSTSSARSSNFSVDITTYNTSIETRTGTLGRGSLDKKVGIKRTPLVERSFSSLNAVNDIGNTKLHQAIVLEDIHDTTQLNSNLKEIERLLKQGVDPNIQNANGDTALHLIGNLPYWNWYHDKIVDILLEYGAKVDIPNEKGMQATHQFVF